MNGATQAESRARTVRWTCFAAAILVVVVAPFFRNRGGPETASAAFVSRVVAPPPTLTAPTAATTSSGAGAEPDLRVLELRTLVEKLAKRFRSLPSSPLVFGDEGELTDWFCAQLGISEAQRTVINRGAMSALDDISLKHAARASLVDGPDGQHFLLEAAPDLYAELEGRFRTAVDSVLNASSERKDLIVKALAGDAWSQSLLYDCEVAIDQRPGSNELSTQWILETSPRTEIGSLIRSNPRDPEEWRREFFGRKYGVLFKNEPPPEPDLESSGQ